MTEVRVTYDKTARRYTAEVVRDYADTVLNEHSPEGENIARVSLAGVHFLRSVAVGLAAIAAALEDR